jgi:Conserved domain frequently associated with peptide methionine sulfoxide reductase
MDKKNPVYSKNDNKAVEINNEEWKKILPADVYHIAREKGTERPFTGKYNKHDDREPIIARLVEIHFSKVMESLIVAADGRVFLNPFQKKV